MGGGAIAQIEIFGSGLSGLGSSLQAILTVFLSRIGSVAAIICIAPLSGIFFSIPHIRGLL